MKLKTLKDLPHYNFEGVPMKNGVAIDERNLKAEVVKWIKRMLKIYEKGDTLAKKHGKITKDFELDLYYYEQDDVVGAVKFAEYFFNITEEDLK